jgi:hypothetical protein
VAQQPPVPAWLSLGLFTVVKAFASPPQPPALSLVGFHFYQPTARLDWSMNFVMASAVALGEHTRLTPAPTAPERIALP